MYLTRTDLDNKGREVIRYGSDQQIMVPISKSMNRPDTGLGQDNMAYEQIRDLNGLETIGYACEDNKWKGWQTSGVYPV